MASSEDFTAINRNRSVDSLTPKKKSRSPSPPPSGRQEDERPGKDEMVNRDAEPANGHESPRERRSA